MKRPLIAALFLVSFASTYAQDMPKQVKDLAWMVGTWAGSGKISFGGNETEVTTKMDISFDGWFLKSVSSDASSQYTLTKTAMTGWDAAKGEYVSYTFTNIADLPRIEHGKLEGDKLVLVSDPWEAEGLTLVGRETLTRISDTKCRLFLEAKVKGKWEKEMDFALTRK